METGAGVCVGVATGLLVAAGEVLAGPAAPGAPDTHAEVAKTTAPAATADSIRNPRIRLMSNTVAVGGFPHGGKGEWMNIGRAPAEITVVRVNAVALLGPVAMNSILLARSFDWAGYEQRGILPFGIVLFGIITLVGTGFCLLPLWLIRRGSRATAVVVTLLGVVTVLPPYDGFNPLLLAALGGAVASTFAVWRPASRAYLQAARRERLDRQLDARGWKAVGRLR